MDLARLSSSFVVARASARLYFPNSHTSRSAGGLAVYSENPGAIHPGLLSGPWSVVRTLSTLSLISNAFATGRERNRVTAQIHPLSAGSGVTARHLFHPGFPDSGTMRDRTPSLTDESKGLTPFGLRVRHDDSTCRPAIKNADRYPAAPSP